jgi:MoxR-like ATPase
MSTMIASVSDLVTEADVDLLRQLPARYRQLADALDQRIVGQDEIIRDLFVALAVEGHVLMIGVPGLAKTLLIRSLAELLDLPFQRIQFTPDLMPSDITGTDILEENEEGQRQFRFVRGPVFASLLLADEINRTTPKTQAALLEAMQEHRVTVAGRTHELPSPFFVMATQNPIEQEGTYPLPEAQLDRFMFNLRVNYPSHDEEVQILLTTTSGTPAPLRKIWTGKELVALQRAVRQIPVPESVAHYAVSLVQATRPENTASLDYVKRFVQWGAGPRASQYLALAGKVFAVLGGRFNVAREDIQRAAKMVLRHRIILNYRAEAEKLTVDALIERLLEDLK